MVMALPVLGMLKVIFDNIDPLKPYGFLIGSQKKENNFKDKLMNFFIKNSWVNGCWIQDTGY